MNWARDLVREWYPDATPEQVETFAAALFRAMQNNLQQVIKKDLQ